MTDGLLSPSLFCYGSNSKLELIKWAQLELETVQMGGLRLAGSIFIAMVGDVAEIR